MKLSDLFVSFKQVSPVKFKNQIQDLPNPIYLNLNRAQKIASGDVTSENSETGTYNWRTKSKSEIEQEQQENDEEDQDKSQNNISEKLINFIKSKEGFSNVPYLDFGVKAIGYGFNNPDITKKDYITEEEANEILINEILTIQEKLKSQIKTWNQLTQNQQDALISYGFNVGAENWNKYQPKLLNALNQKNFKEASKYIDVTKVKGKVLPGLVKRRQEEQLWFNS